jgi:hypothetical protein
MQRPGWLFSWLSFVPAATLKADVKTRYSTLQYQLYSRFLADPQSYLNLLFEDEPLSRDDGE